MEKKLLPLQIHRCCHRNILHSYKLSPRTDKFIRWPYPDTIFRCFVSRSRCPNLSGHCINYGGPSETHSLDRGCVSCAALQSTRHSCHHYRGRAPDVIWPANKPPVRDDREHSSYSLNTCNHCFDGQFLLLSQALSRGCTASIAKHADRYTLRTKNRYSRM